MQRTIRLIALTLILSTATYAGVATTAQAHDRASVENGVLQLINKTRAQHGLRALRFQADLDRGAIAHSRQMVSRDYFSHYSAGGASYAQRLLAAGYTRSGYRTWSVGEVIGWGTSVAGTPQAIVKAWMGSSVHRAVILDGRLRDVGVGCAQGTFRGIPNTLMYTVDFGRRAR